VHSVGARLKVWRKAVGLQQEGAAAHLGLSPSTYQNYERGTRRPDTDGWEAFVRAGINANWLLTGDGPMLLAELAALPAQTQSMSASPLDTEILAYVIEEVEKVLVARRQTLPAPRKAALIQLIYDYCAELGKREPGMVERFLKFAA